MTKHLEYLGLGVLVPTLLGIQLQGMGSKTNTAVRAIDLCMNLFVIGFFLWALIRNIPLSPPLRICWGVWAVKCLLNIYPLCEIFFNQAVSPKNETSVVEFCERIKDFFRVPDLKSPVPCVFISNHALGSLDDILSIGALTHSSLSVMINGEPSGLTVIPRSCRERMCVLPSGSNRYETAKRILREEILEAGKSMIVFPEDMRKKTSVDTLAPLRTGVIHICWELGIPVVPVWFDWPSLFPSVFGDTRKQLGGRKSPRPLFPREFSDSKIFHREITRELESLARG